MYRLTERELEKLFPLIDIGTIRRQGSAQGLLRQYVEGVIEAQKLPLFAVVRYDVVLSEYIVRVGLNQDAQNRIYSNVHNAMAELGLWRLEPVYMGVDVAILTNPTVVIPEDMRMPGSQSQGRNPADTPEGEEMTLGDYRVVRGRAGWILRPMGSDIGIAAFSDFYAFTTWQDMIDFLGRAQHKEDVRTKEELREEILREEIPKLEHSIRDAVTRQMVVSQTRVMDEMLMGRSEATYNPKASPVSAEQRIQEAQKYQAAQQGYRTVMAPPAVPAKLSGAGLISGILGIGKK